ncbi:DNA gyrase inhibitor SbmC [Dickeya dadantii]|uniref:DNA gyrase inhibitor SbmC n=1 Tax=Dickeya dadantii TaxID=204038 RepID=UPI001495E14A|nr:DNA gyrase inhibitor SbmC [Dickeya dadantii]NPE72299.1 DNA gyrase inhibitor SbmC [Dickeya dadantii]UAY97026.1 DNA gyrase inhibitor SbmC [Dickeya dadantii]
MNYNVQHVDKRHAAGFHLVGPWEQTVPQGFEQLMKWVDEHAVQPLEWVAVYYGNPQETPPEKLTADTVVSVSADFRLPADGEGAITTEIAAGQYAIARVRVSNDDFGMSWQAFFAALLGDGKTIDPARACFEVYLNDGYSDGFWDIDMHIPVQ